jgi:hypothetical protein
MARERETFEVLRAGEMRAKYGLTAENRPEIHLDPSRVPDGLRHLIPLAERFGISDDLIRDDFLAKTPKAELLEMKKIVYQHQDLFERWLAGPQSSGPTFSDEYVAFTCLLMSADSVQEPREE